MSELSTAGPIVASSVRSYEPDRLLRSVLDVRIYDLVEYRARNGFGRAVAQLDGARFGVCLDMYHAMLDCIAGCISATLTLDSHFAAIAHTISPALNELQ